MRPFPLSAKKRKDKARFFIGQILDNVLGKTTRRAYIFPHPKYKSRVNKHYYFTAPNNKFRNFSSSFFEGFDSGTFARYFDSPFRSKYKINIPILIPSACLPEEEPLSGTFPGAEIRLSIDTLDRSVDTESFPGLSSFKPTNRFPFGKPDDTALEEDGSKDLSESSGSSVVSPCMNQTKSSKPDNPAMDGGKPSTESEKSCARESATSTSSSGTIGKANVNDILLSQQTKDSQFKDIAGSTIKRTAFLRFSGTLAISKVQKFKEDPELAVARQIGEALDSLAKFTGSDPVVSRWRTRYSDTPPISLTKGSFADQFCELPLSLLRKYLNRISIRPNTTNVWFDIGLFFNGEEADLSETARNDLSLKHGLKLFRKGIQQSEDTSTIGWILWASTRIDQSPLKKELERVTKMEVELKLTRISDGPKAKKNGDDWRTYQGWHIIVGSEVESDALAVISKVFSTNSKIANPVIGNKRLVTPYGKFITSLEEDYARSARNRQFNFNAQAVILETLSISDLDRRITTSAKESASLRGLISCIRSKNRKSPLFLDVGRSSQFPDRHFLICAPIFREEAQSIVPILFPYLRHFHGDDVAKCFSVKTIQTLSEVNWDPVTQRTTSARDEAFKKLDSIDKDYGFEQLSEVEVEVTTERMVDQTPSKQDALTSRLITGNEDIDTLGSLNDARKGVAPLKAPIVPDELSVSSKSTTRSTRSKFEKLRRTLQRAGFPCDDDSLSTTNSLEEQMNNMENTLQAIAAAKVSTKPPNTNSSSNIFWWQRSRSASEST